MERLTRDLEEQLREAFSRAMPQREFGGHHVVQVEPSLVVRVFSQAKGRAPLLPSPYQVFVFDAESLQLRELTGPEAQPYQLRGPRK
jgi:hypothetical protein